MLCKTFTSGRIRRGDYNPESQQLDLHWDNKSVLAYKQVPQEVFRRLCSAPNPASWMTCLDLAPEPASQPWPGASTTTST